MYFVRGRINSTRVRKYFPYGRRNISSTGDFLMGETFLVNPDQFTLLTNGCVAYADMVVLSSSVHKLKVTAIAELFSLTNEGGAMSSDHRFKTV